MRIDSNTMNAIIADIVKGVYAHPNCSILESYNDGDIEVRADVDNELYLLHFEISGIDCNAIDQQQYEWLVFEVEEQLKQARAELQSEALYLKSR